MAVALSFCIVLLLTTNLMVLADTKYRICVVPNKSKKITKYCPLLENNAESLVQCVMANNRLECMMMISAGKADFAVLEAEDLVAAGSKLGNILITNDIRFVAGEKYAYEMVAIVRNGSDIGGVSDLRDKVLCHPGYGYEPQWTEVISRFLEARVVPQLCNASMTLTENRIKSSSAFFKSGCKAGSWVPKLELDSKLKQKYPNLCEACDTPNSCSTLDKYWGRRGSLFCLTDGAGDVSWARLDDARSHFALEKTTLPPMGDPKLFSYLCPNSTLLPMDTVNPCTWLARPWPVVATSLATASKVQKLVSSLDTFDMLGWQWALDRLMSESTAEEVVALDAMRNPEDYLTDAPGFTSANSLSDCTPAKPIRVCTSTRSAYDKCGWLKEAARAFGIEPALSCLLAATSTSDCLTVARRNLADVVLTHPDLLLEAIRDNDMTVLLYEFSNNMDNQYNAVAVVKKESPLNSLKDLRGKKACFPSYRGVSWTSALALLQNQSLLSGACPGTGAAAEFFGDSCVPGLDKTSPHFRSSLQALCKDDPVEDLLVLSDKVKYAGESGAFRCLVEGGGDVAFIDKATLKNNTDSANNEASWTNGLKSANFRTLCMGFEKCSLGWATQGQVMIMKNLSKTRADEILDTFLQLDNVFGKHYKAHTPSFQMFAPFNGQRDVLFHDATQRLEDLDYIRREGSQGRNYETMIAQTKECSSSQTLSVSSIAVLLTLVVNFF